MKIKYSYILLFLFGCCFSLPAAAAPLNVLTSVYPVYVFTKNVVADVPNVKLELLLSPEHGCPHDYALTPGDLKNIAQADIFFVNGLGLEEYLGKVRQNFPLLNVVETSAGVSLIADYEEKDQANPHTFVSPASAIIQVRNIAAALQKADPQHSDLYQKNMEQYQKQLKTLLAAFITTVQKLPRKKIITFHDAFAYLARDVGLEVAGVIEATPGQEPSAGELTRLVQLIKQHQLKAVFAEPQYSPRLAEVLAAEGNARLYILDPAAGAKYYAADSYIKIMEQNRLTLEKALGK